MEEKMELQNNSEQVKCNCSKSGNKKSWNSLAPPKAVQTPKGELVL